MLVGAEARDDIILIVNDIIMLVGASYFCGTDKFCGHSNYIKQILLNLYHPIGHQKM